MAELIITDWGLTILARYRRKNPDLAHWKAGIIWHKGQALLNVGGYLFMNLLWMLLKMLLFTLSVAAGVLATLRGDVPLTLEYDI